MEFYNREKELRDLLNMIKQEPNMITFIYGPINSGKTVLMQHLVENILPKEYVAFYINLRGEEITKEEEFYEILFETYEEKDFSIEKIVDKISRLSFGIPISFGTFKLMFERREKDYRGVFRYIIKTLQKLKEKGLMPIIIFDELQVIKDVKVNEPLIYRLFNLFIRLTKELKLCHVFAITSDSTFIERIYNEAMLQGRSRYYLVDDFDRKTVERVLRSKGFSDEEINLVWYYFGGKPIYLVEAIQTKKVGKDVKELCEEFYEIRYGQLEEIIYKEKRLNERRFEEIIELLKEFRDKNSLKYKEINPTIQFLIEKNILFADPRKKILKPQSHLELIAIRNLLKEMEQ